MSPSLRTEKPSLIGVTVKMTPQEHRLLRAVLFAEGHSSFQDFFRTLVVQRIKASGGGLSTHQEPSHVST
jgi:hypothetical protein